MKIAQSYYGAFLLRTFLLSAITARLVHSSIFVTPIFVNFPSHFRAYEKSDGDNFLNEFLTLSEITV